MENSSRSSRPLKAIILAVAATVAALLAYAAFGLLTPDGEKTTAPPGSRAASDQTQILGNPMDIDLATGMSTLTLDGSKKASIRFTAKMSGEATSIAINILHSNQTSQAVAGLQRDSDGMPEGAWMGEDSGVLGTPDRNGFAVTELQKPIELQEGEIYHIVIETVESASLSIKAYKANGHAQPLNYHDTDIVWPDSAMDMLSYDGTKWNKENKWPIFAVIYSDGRMEGQPYSLLAPWVIYGSTYVGQQIVPSSDYAIRAISFVVSLEGEPLDRLYYEVRDSENNQMANGVFAEADSLARWKSWVEAKLDTPVLFKKGELYRIFLYSPETNLENSYRVYGHEFSFDSRIGYGGTVHQLVVSYDAGSRWIDWIDADTVFKLEAVA